MHTTERMLGMTGAVAARRAAGRAAAALALMAAALGAGTPAHAQAGYTAIDLTPDAGWAFARGADGIVSGYAGATSSTTHAMLWGADGALDVHPAFVTDPATGLGGRSVINGAGGGLQVGSAAGPGSANRSVPTVWRGDAASATALAIPFVNNGAEALATDGVQIAGWSTALDRDGTTFGPTHAVVWDASTGAAIDLGDGGNGARANGVANGQQVGFVVKSQAGAAVWSSTEKSLVTMNPNGAVLSVANATDGTRQAGYAGYDIRVRQEAAKGNKTQRFTWATTWQGTAASAQNIHPAPVNANVAFTNSWALGMSSTQIAGYATEANGVNHAIVWNADLSSVDLNAFLPAGFTAAQAYAVDANGTVAGVMVDAAGHRHAVAWVPNA